MTPMVTINQSSPLLLNVSDVASLMCMGMGGPRLVLTWDRDSIAVVNGTMVDDTLQHSFTANNNTFGTYTCTATIDDMAMFQSVDVVGMCYIFCVWVCLSVCWCTAWG